MGCDKRSNSPKKSSSSKKSKRCPKKVYGPQKVGRITNNGYLNYLRDFKQKHVGLSPRMMVSKGARAWNKLPCKCKEHYRKMGEKAGCKSEPN